MALPAAHTNYGEIMESRPGRAMVELHDEAITALLAAIEAIAAQKIEERFNETAAAMQAVTALYAMIDQNNGGELALNLGRVYHDVLTKLGRLAFDSDPTTLARQSIDLLKPLRDAWDGLDRREAGEEEPVAPVRKIISGAKASAGSKVSAVPSQASPA